jgi:TPR repeat protein
MSPEPASDPSSSRATRATIALRISGTQRMLPPSATRLLAAFVADDLLQRAMKGDAAAQAEYGQRLLLGNGVMRNKREGRQWCRRAAEQGHPLGQFLLGGCYYNGEGGLADSIRAFMWFILAADQGIKEAIIIIRRLLASQLDESHLREAKRLARAFRPNTTDSP